MKTNISVLFILITIFGIPRTFAGTSSQEDDEAEASAAPVPFDLDSAKRLLNGLLDYFNDLGALAGDYETIKAGIDNASDADSVIKAGREILSDKGSQGNLVEKAEEDEDVATTMKEKIDAYKNAFWKLLDEAGLDGGQIPCATRLNAIRQKCVESSPDY